jgi:hypothetical protein
MMVAIHQLHYLPWLRYMEKIARADIFVALDDVQYTKNGYQNRNRLKHAGGWMHLTVPVKERAGQLLHEVEIAEVDGWRQKHWRALQTNYSKARYCREHEEAFARIYQRRWTHLNALNWELLSYLCVALGIQTPLVRSSQLGVEGRATERLIHICRSLGADRYYSGSHAARTYLDRAAMEAAGIEVVLQEWICPAYRQCFPELEFIPDLSVVDLLLNEGPASLDILRGERRLRGESATADLRGERRLRAAERVTLA